MSALGAMSQHSSTRRPGPPMWTMNVHSSVEPSGSVITTVTV